MIRNSLKLITGHSVERVRRVGARQGRAGQTDSFLTG
jgi:hypothetical protein